MKIFPCSDLHLEFVETNERINVLEKILPAPTKVDVLVLAGDIFSYNIKNKLNIVKYLCDTYDNVIFVPGNHEYYEGSFEDVDLLLRVYDRAFDNFYYLNNNHVFIDGYMFVGSTLWFDYDKTNEGYEKYLNDFNLIYNGKKHIYEMNDLSIGYLNQICSSGMDECMVITHHAPHENSLQVNKFKEGLPDINRFFYSRRGMELLDEWQPMYWIHGHTHHPVNYFVGKTNVISNPCGYNWTQKVMNNKLIIEVE